MDKKYLLPIFIIFFLVVSASIYAAPDFNVFRHIRPETNNAYDIGSATSTWRSGFIRIASTSTLTISNLGNTGTVCLQITNQGVVGVASAACGSGSGGGTSDFTYVMGTGGRYLTPTSTAVGIVTDASSTITRLMSVLSTTTQATSTNLFVSDRAVISTSSIGSLNVGYISATSTSASSTFQNLFFINGQATTLSLSGNVNFAGITGSGVVSNANLANSTISGVALGSNLEDLTATNGTLTFSGTYNGSTARTIGLNLAQTNTWTGRQTFSELFATNSTTTNATTTNISATFASTTNLTVSALNAANCDVKSSTSGVFSCGTDATGGGSAVSTIADSEEVLACNPQTDSTWFAPGGSFVDVLGENLLGIQMYNATSSSIYCRWHIPDRIATTSEAVLYTSYTATTSGNFVFDLYASTTDPTSGVYGANTAWTISRAGSTTASVLWVIKGSTAYPSNSTTTSLSEFTLTPGQDLILKMVRVGADADDTVENGILFIKNYIRFSAKVN